MKAMEKPNWGFLKYLRNIGVRAGTTTIIRHIYQVSSRFLGYNCDLTEHARI